ncbi:MAG: hypothetical protein B6245_10275 [Desulfobacteraceae bacterium 4572_88]|nr:MAG: hypothetical protein B6245_10275 [Desulfobacteraceae bacterium 4572_88]
MKFSTMPRLVLIFIMVIIVPMLVFTLVNMKISKTQMERDLQISSAQALNTAKNILNEHAKRMENIAELLAGMSEIKEKMGSDDAQLLIRSELDARHGMYPTELIELFDKNRQILARAYDEKEDALFSFFTDPEDAVIGDALDMEKHTGYFVYPSGFVLKASCPVIETKTTPPLGAIVVTHPFTPKTLQAIKKRVRAEVTLQWNFNNSFITTIQDEKGVPLARLWENAPSSFEMMEGQFLQHQESIADAPYAIAYTPLRNRDEQIVGILSAAVRSDVIHHLKEDMSLTILISFLSVFALAIIVGGMTARSFIRPVRQMTAAVRTMSLGNFEEPLALDRQDELGELSRAIHQMGVQLREKSQKAEVEKTDERYGYDFLAKMGHDIRTPMSSIIGFTNLALKTELTPRQQDYLNKIDTSAVLLLGVINDILDFSKIEAGKLELESVGFRLDDITENLSDMFSGKIAEKGLEIIISVGREVPLGLIGDPLRLNQVLTHLVDNAISFTDKGEVIIRVDPVTGYELQMTDHELRVRNGAVRRSASHTVMLRFSVRDTGTGISQEHLTQLLESLTQPDRYPTQEYGGAGLGLTICKRLIDMMGGELWLESEPASGSTFSFISKFGVQPDDEVPARKTERAGEKENLAQSVKKIRGKKVLLVEDNIINQQVATEILERAGVNVKIANNGKNAVEAVSRAAYDAVLMDVQMPEMDGLEATRTIRTWETELWSSVSADKNGISYRARVPIIAMTAHAMKGDREKCLESGMDDYIPKPIDTGQLFIILARWMGDGEEASPDEDPMSSLQMAGHDDSPPLPESIPGIDIGSAMK